MANDKKEEEEENAAACPKCVAIAFREKFLECVEFLHKVYKAKDDLRDLEHEYAETLYQLGSLLCVGEPIAEVLQQIDNERVIITDRQGRYVAGCCSTVDKTKLISGSRVALDPYNLIIVRVLPREVNPVVYNMLHHPPVTSEWVDRSSYAEIGGLADQIRELRECIELPLTMPELFLRIGVKPPKAILLYGPPGTGKTLLARTLADNVHVTFLKIASTVIVQEYIGAGEELIREIFAYAHDHQPCIIFMDEIDAICGRRLNKGSVGDREIQRILIQLLNQLDGFDPLGKVKVIMATNRPDVLDPALLRPGRIDRKIEIPLPNEHSRLRILEIHASQINIHGDVDYELVAKLAEGFNGADIRNICTEAGISAIREERDYVVHEDFMKAVRKVSEVKKLEAIAHYNAHFGND